MKLSLVVLTPGKGEGKVIPMTLSQFIIGRDPQCHLRPASPVISKRHCAVMVRGEQAFLRDFDSTNGTFLNDEPVKGEVELKNGDRLKAGPLAFAIQIEAGVAAAPAPAPAKAAVKAPAKAAAPAVKQAPAKAAAPAAEEQDLAATALDGMDGMGGGGEDDESIADMLLSLGDDAPSTGSAIVPEGSTIMDIPVPPPGTEAPGEKNKGKDKMGQAKAAQASTSNAAKAILDKYMKRPRGT